jgi:hypothetical protein
MDRHSPDTRRFRGRDRACQWLGQGEIAAAAGKSLRSVPRSVIADGLFSDIAMRPSTQADDACRRFDVEARSRYFRRKLLTPQMQQDLLAVIEEYKEC